MAKNHYVVRRWYGTKWVYVINWREQATWTRDINRAEVFSNKRIAQRAASTYSGEVHQPQEVS